MPRPVHARSSPKRSILRHHGVIKYADGPQCTGRQESPQSGRNKAAGLGGKKQKSRLNKKKEDGEKERKDSLEEESQIR
jgi:hypothetical protein